MPVNSLSIPGINANKTASRNATLTSYYPIPYSAGNYYIEGATTIVYDSMGSNPSYYKDPYKIFTCNTNENLADKKIIRAGVESDKPKYDILWRIVYYKKDKTPGYIFFEGFDFNGYKAESDGIEPMLEKTFGGMNEK